MGDNDNLLACTNGIRWYDGDFVSTFAALSVHYSHRTHGQQHGEQSTLPDMPQLIVMTYPRQELLPTEFKSLPIGRKCVVAVIHDVDHYAVMEILLDDTKVLIFDGLGQPLVTWMDHVSCHQWSIEVHADGHK